MSMPCSPYENVAGQKQKTKVVKDSDAPEWNEVSLHLVGVVG